MKRTEQLAFIAAVCFAPLMAMADTNAVEAATNVLGHLRQIKAQEGPYFAHVWRILGATNGVPELITQTKSEDPEVAALASNLLWMISAPSWEKNRNPTNDWAAWWQDRGSKMAVQQLWHNFDSYHK